MQATRHQTPLCMHPAAAQTKRAPRLTQQTRIQRHRSPGHAGRASKPYYRCAHRAIAAAEPRGHEQILRGQKACQHRHIQRRRTRKTSALQRNQEDSPASAIYCVASVHAHSRRPLCVRAVRRERRLAPRRLLARRTTRVRPTEASARPQSLRCVRAARREHCLPLRPPQARPQKQALFRSGEAAGVGGPKEFRRQRSRAERPASGPSPPRQLRGCLHVTRRRSLRPPARLPSHRSIPRTECCCCARPTFG